MPAAMKRIVIEENGSTTTIKVSATAKIRIVEPLSRKKMRPEKSRVATLPTNTNDSWSKFHKVGSTASTRNCESRASLVAYAKNAWPHASEERHEEFAAFITWVTERRPWGKLSERGEMPPPGWSVRMYLAVDQWAALDKTLTCDEAKRYFRRNDSPFALDFSELRGVEADNVLDILNHRETHNSPEDERLLRVLREARPYQ